MAFNNNFNAMPSVLENEFFDFAAASIETASIQDNASSSIMASHTHPAQSYNSTSVMPLSQAEIEVIVAMRNKEAAQEKYERENPSAFGMLAPTTTSKARKLLHSTLRGFWAMLSIQSRQFHSSSSPLRRR